MTPDIRAIDGFDGIHLARLGKLTATVFRLHDGSFCLYSPVAGLETALARYLRDLGDVSALLAPNHYHNKGLKVHVQVFPVATLYCSARAEPRLAKVTGLTFDTLDRLRDKLPGGISLHEPDGLKTGEVWLRAITQTECALAVTDAFNATLHPPGSYADSAGLLGTFPRYGIKDGTAYKTWATEFFAETAPSVLLPCHGSPVKTANLAKQLVDLIQDAF